MNSADSNAMKSRFERPPRPNRRVVVTGVGALTPIGLDAEESWKNAINGVSGIAKLTQFSTEGMHVQIAGEVKSFPADQYVPRKEQKRMERFVQLALAASQQALEQSGLEITESIAPRVGTIIGVGMGGLKHIEINIETMLNRGANRISPFFIPMVISNMAAGHVSIRFGVQGPNFATTSACASGGHAIGEAAEAIRRGQCDAMICGGAESAVTMSAIGGFSSMKALSTRNDQPNMASRPFDKDRDGFVLSEGAASLILEDLEHAEKRGAHIIAEVTGYGTSSDAYHMTNPAIGGKGAALAMDFALKDAHLSPDKISYINAHGTSTPAGDIAETQAIHKVFGEFAKKTWVSSSKSMIGHTLGAAGAIESVISILALRDGIAPPTINLESPDDECDLDYIPAAAREKRFEHVMNNSFGFGGTNTCLIFSRFD